MNIELIFLFGVALLASGNIVATVSLLLRKPATPLYFTPPVVVSQPQLASASQGILTNAPSIVKCTTCGHFVARFTVTPTKGAVCANCDKE